MCFIGTKLHVQQIYPPISGLYARGGALPPYRTPWITQPYNKITVDGEVLQFHIPVSILIDLFNNKNTNFAFFAQIKSSKELSISVFQECSVFQHSPYP